MRKIKKKSMSGGSTGDGTSHTFLCVESGKRQVWCSLPPVPPSLGRQVWPEVELTASTFS